MRFALVSGLPDSSETVVYGVSTLRTGAINHANNEKISVGCLIKIEMNIPAKALRITCKTLSQSATTALMQSAKSILA
jgi:hypothetical protein